MSINLNTDGYTLISKRPAVAVVSPNRLKSAIAAQFYHYERVSALMMIEKSHVRSKKLSEVAKRKSKRININILREKQYKYVGLADIDSSTGEITPSSAESITGTSALFFSGDILYSKLRPYLNKVALCPESIRCAAGSTELVVYTCKPNINRWYIFAVVKSSVVLNQLIKITSGSTHPRVDPDFIDESEIPFPDGKIQDYIGLKIKTSEICRSKSTELSAQAKMVLEECLGSKIENILNNIKQEGVFENGGFSVTVEPDLLRNRLDPIGYHPELLSIQKSLHSKKPKYQRLRKLAKLSTNVRSRVNSDCSFFVSVLHVDNKGYLDRGAASEYYPESPGREAKPDDILVSCINPAANRIAVCDDMKGTIACSPEFAILESKELPPHYLAFVLRSDLVYRQMIHLGKGTSSSRRRIDEEELFDLEIPVVSRADEIATLIKKRQKLISIAFQLTTEAKADVEALIEGKLDADAILSGKLKAPTWEDIEKELEGI